MTRNVDREEAEKIRKDYSDIPIDTEQQFTASRYPDVVIHLTDGTFYADGRDSELYSGPSLGQAIIDAIASFGDRGGLVKLPKGENTHDKKVVIDQRHNFIGSGIESTALKASDALSDHMFEFSPSTAEGHEFFPSWRWLYLAGNKDGRADTTSHGILATDVDGGNPYDLHISHCMFGSHPADGLHFEGSWGYRIHDSLSEFNDGNGIYIEGKQNHLRGLFCANNGETGLYSGSKDTKLIDVNCHENGDIGLDSRGNRTLIDGVISRGNDDAGLYIAGSEVRISNVVAYGNAQGGAPDFSSGVRVSGNNIGLENITSIEYQTGVDRTQEYGIRTGGTKEKIFLNNIYVADMIKIGLNIGSDYSQLSNFVVTGCDSYGLNLGGNNIMVTNGRALGNGTDILVAGADVCIRNVDYGSITNSGTRLMVDGRYYPPLPTINLGGTAQNINPVSNPVSVYDIQVDAGGLATTVYGIGNINQVGNTVILYHTGGETITLAHNDTTNGVDPMLFKNGGADRTLDANGEMIALEYDGQNSKWREKWVNLV